VVRAEGDLRCNRLQKPPDRHMSLFSFPRASDWTATVGHCFTPGHCHFAPRHLLVLGVLNSHRNLESHQVTLPSSSYAILYIYSQGTAEHRDHRASPNCFLSRFDQRGSSHTMDDHQITCNLKDKAQEGSHTRSNSCYLSLIQHLHYKKPCPSLYPVIFNIKGPAYTLPLQDLSLQPTNISLFLSLYSCLLFLAYNNSTKLKSTGVETSQQNLVSRSSRRTVALTTNRSEYDLHHHPSHHAMFIPSERTQGAVSRIRCRQPLPHRLSGGADNHLFFPSSTSQKHNLRQRYPSQTPFLPVSVHCSWFNKRS
jgi:hypothetical protein